jgi:hypothetical protein
VIADRLVCAHCSTWSRYIGCVSAHGRRRPNAAGWCRLQAISAATELLVLPSWGARMSCLVLAADRALSFEWTVRSIGLWCAIPPALRWQLRRGQCHGRWTANIGANEWRSPL